MALVAGAVSKGGRNYKGPQLAIVYRPIDQLKLNPDNPRIHSEKQITQVARSIEVFGPIVPVLIDSNSQVIAGHGRIQAAQQLGLKEFPTICAEHLTEAQAKAFAIADNRLTEIAVWDERLLAAQLKSLAEVELDFRLDVIGFEVGEIDVLIEGVAPAVEGDSDPAMHSRKPMHVSKSVVWTTSGYSAGIAFSAVIL